MLLKGSPDLEKCSDFILSGVRKKNNQKVSGDKPSHLRSLAKEIPQEL